MNEQDSNANQEQPESLTDLEMNAEQAQETKAGGIDQDKTLWEWRKIIID